MPRNTELSEIEQPASNRLAGLILRWREDSGLSQGEAAAMLDCVQAALSRFENGQTIPLGYWLERMAQVFCVSKESLAEAHRLAAIATQTRRLTAAVKRIGDDRLAGMTQGHNANASGAQ